MILETLQDNSAKIDEMLLALRQQLLQLRKHAVRKAVEEKLKAVKQENDQLRHKVSLLKRELIACEEGNGVEQIPLPKHLSQTKFSPPTPSQHVTQQTKPSTTPTQQTKVPPQQSKESQKTDSSTSEKSSKEEKPQKAKKNKAEKPAAEATKGASREVDVSMLNMKVGRIMEVKRHPDADTLYVEEVDVGESSRRTIISGLVTHVPIEQMKDRVAVFLLNLKPAKMRGLVSQGMIMCASTPEKVEIIEVPPGAKVGDRVVVDGFPGDAEEVLNPKKKWWESIQPDLRIDHQGVATYKGKQWTVSGQGPFKAPSLKDTPIK